MSEQTKIENIHELNIAENGNQTLDIFNKNHNFAPLSYTGINIGRCWCTWKHKFLSFLQKEDAKELYKNQWTIVMLMLIGPIGEEAYKNLFPSVHEVKDLETVLCQLDIHFIFGNRKKQNNENVDKYIDNLMFVAIASNHSDPVGIVKEKIIQDIKSHNFTGKAMLFIRSKGEDLAPFLRSLDLHQITLFWKQCEEFALQKNRENVQAQSSNSQFTEMQCVRCGTCHDRNSCPAHGAQCDKCKGYNHFTDNCKIKYVFDCSKCGTHHVQSRCLAFGELCRNCGKVNHFSWLCKVPIVKNCLRCGGDHAMSMCPAQGRVCSRCKKPNHMEEKCLSRLQNK